MKQFEIPYNFDYELISALYKLNIPDAFHCIYVSPYWEDYISAKYNLSHPNGKDMNDNKKLNRQEYEKHIFHIDLHFPNKLMLLLQQNNYCISKELLIYYHNLGFHKFCVGNLEQAEQIKQLYPNDEVIGSITMKIMPQDLQDNKYEIFDGFVLWFPYNRNLPIIKQLPKKYKYVLLVNCDCNIYCPGTHHWFASKEDEQITRCPGNNNWENLIRIEHRDLQLFEPYISYFKLQGREFCTFQIIREFLSYLSFSQILPPQNLEIAYFNPMTNKLLNLKEINNELYMDNISRL